MFTWVRREDPSVSGMRCLWDTKWKRDLEMQFGKHYDTMEILVKGLNFSHCEYEICEKQAENEAQKTQEREMVGDKRRLLDIMEIKRVKEFPKNRVMSISNVVFSHKLRAC